MIHKIRRKKKIKRISRKKKEKKREKALADVDPRNLLKDRLRQEGFFLQFLYSSSSQSKNAIHPREKEKVQKTSRQ